MTNKKIFIPFLAIVLGIAPATGQDAFDQTIDIIVNSNSQVRSERDLAKAVALDNADANSLANPEVAFSRVWGTRSVGNKLQLDITQSFDWPGLYGARRKANLHQQNAAEMLCLWTELDVALQAKLMLVEFVYVHKQIGMYQGLLENVQQLGQAIAAAQKQGYSTELDRRKIAIEEYKILQQVAAITSRLAQIECDIKAMASCPLDLTSIVAYPIEPTLSLEEYCEQIRTLDPQIAAAALTEDAEAYGAKAAKMLRYPGFSVGYQHQTELGDHFNGFSVSVSLPIYEDRHAKGAAQARIDAAQSQSLALLSKKTWSTHAIYMEMLQYRTCVQHYNDVFGDNAYLNLIRKAYDGGELSVFEYITEVQYYSEATQAYLEAEYNFHSTLTELNKYNLIKNHE